GAPAVDGPETPAGSVEVDKAT
ncbi:MAG: hypothetical protein JWN31_1876, partial [Frankiales bacterium]|nr:hypothetical protein [Frankiales bacterium]